MDEVKIVITPDAEDDIRQIYNYIAEYSLNAALAQVDRFLGKFELLRKFPRMGMVIDNLGNERLRSFQVGRYRIAYYLVSEIQIDILRVHSSAKP